MKRLDFSLIPFSKINTSTMSGRFQIGRFQISGTVRRGVDEIIIDYIITDPYYSIVWPAPVQQPQRLDSLWENTCFELFIAPWGGKHYWEFNFSPSSNWNCYRFSDYRNNQGWEPNIHHIESTLTDDGDKQHNFQVRIPLFNDIQNVTASLGISAVIRDNTGTLHYYALAHTGETPDFHNRNCFMLTLTK